MRASSLIQISLALVLALVAGVLVFRFMQVNRAAAPQVAAPEQVELVVAAADVPRGAKLKTEQLKLAPFLKASAPSGGFGKDAMPVGRVLSAPVAAGEPITEARLLQDGEAHGGVSTLIAPGMRAVAVKGNKVLGLSGFIRPGNHVDVLVTIDDETREKSKSRTKLVLDNVRVLATGNELKQEGDDTSTSSVDVYTLEITPQQAEPLALAASRGELHFALRNPADDTKVLTPGTDVPGTLALLTSTPEGKPVRKTRETTVEMISGTERSTLRFEQ